MLQEDIADAVISVADLSIVIVPGIYWLKASLNNSQENTIAHQSFWEADFCGGPLH